MSKLLRVSQKGNMAKIGETIEDSEWFYLSDAVQRFMKANITLGDVVTIQTETEQGKDRPVITKVAKSGGSATTATSTTAAEPRRTSAPSSSSAPTAGSRDESIVRQVVLKATASTLIAMQGHIDPNNYKEVAEGVFEFWSKKMGV